MEIKGKKAVIVGGASGMAKASAEMLAERGASVAIVDLPTSKGAEVAEALGGSFHPLDVTDDEAVELVMSEVAEALGGLHIAVNTAGGGVAKRTLSKEGPHRSGVVPRHGRAQPIATFNLNRWQAFHMAKNEPEDDERGVIINTASIAAFEGQIGQVAYTAAKAGIAGMALTMARDLGSLGIRVVAIAPSLFSTGHHVDGSRTSSPRRSPRTPRSRSGWADPRSTGAWPWRSSRRRCSTARASASTPASASPRSDPAGRQTRSMMMAGAIPPPAHIVTRPSWPSRRSSSSSTVPTSSAPVAPMG